MKFFVIMCVLMAAVAADDMPEGMKRKRAYDLGYGYHAPVLSHSSYVAAPAPIYHHAPIAVHAVPKVATSYVSHVAHHGPVLSHAPLIAHAAPAVHYAHAPVAVAHAAPVYSHAPYVAAPIHHSPFIHTIHRR